MGMGGLAGDGQVIFSKVQEARAESVRLRQFWFPSNVITGGCAERQLPGPQQFLFNVIAMAGKGEGGGHV